MLQKREAAADNGILFGCKKERSPGLCSHWGTLKTLFSLKEAGHKSMIPFIGHRRRRAASEETGSRCVAAKGRGQGRMGKGS